MAKVIPNEELTLPMLYKLDSQGVVRVWRAWTVLNEDGTAVEHNESGIEGGKLSGIPITVTQGKNLGKKNERTPLQVANIKIQGKFDKKVREGYVMDLSEFTQQGVMKAMDYRIAKHRMTRTFLHQPKLDGIRCKVIAGSSFKMTTKTNKDFKEHIYNLPWARALSENMPESTEVDGELYFHGLELNEISRLVGSYKYNTEEFLRFCEDTEDGLKINLKKKDIGDQVFVGSFYPYYDNNLNQFVDIECIEEGRNKSWTFPGYTTEDVELVGTSQLEYWVFDMPDEDSSAEVRNYNLGEFISSLGSVDGLVLVEAEEGDIEDLSDINDRYVSQGFEGTMLRNPASRYAFGDRTPGLMKYKLFFDAEWTIIGYTVDREGNPNFVFRSDTGDEFECRPTGTREWRARVLRDIDTIIGSRATIRYQKLHADTLIPQFGRVIAIRDYE